MKYRYPTFDDYLQKLFFDEPGFTTKENFEAHYSSWLEDIDMAFVIEHYANDWAKTLKEDISNFITK